MLRNRVDTEPSGNYNEKAFDEMPNGEKFETDTQKIIRRHLSDKEHVITEEEIASIRIGMTPPAEQQENEA